ncbi:MAG: T9SS type A sorting domain-containing protein [Bacteroidales bacterium]|nr:T9SS type A sorting domain-containing protein [Bacteroidales bacterium]MCF8457370.1 T9SS type A sorting domain-containing protein [Bacteroidales bacterium]
MNKLIRYLLQVFFIFYSISAYSQSYSIDNTWNPDSIMLNHRQSEFPTAYKIYEDENGRVFISGTFRHGNYSDIKLRSFNCFNQDGSIYPDFDLPYEIDKATLIKVVHDTLIIAQWRGIPFKCDMFGNYLPINNQYHDNLEESMYHPGITYGVKYQPDGSVLAYGYGFKLIAAPTEYELVRFKPDGHLDSTILINPCDEPNTNIGLLFKYDEERYFAEGIFNHWYGKYVNSFCRFYLETGELDTTFHNIFESQMLISGIVTADNKIVVTGSFYFPGDSTKYTITRLNSDGSLDSTFNTFNAAKQTGLGSFFISPICPLPEGGYLVGGQFNRYQGYVRGSIAKIDKNGYLDTSVFNGSGLDSCWESAQGHGEKGFVVAIEPTKDNKYYIGGQFKYFNGQRVSPVIRINGNEEFSIEEPKVTRLQLCPNPAKEKLSISSGSIIGEVEIYNQSGSLIYKAHINSKQKSIDVSHFTPGNYILRAMGKEEVFVEKFVVVR